MKVGVLALQGDVREHINALAECGVAAVPVRSAPEISSIDGLVLPGGESTTIAKLARSFELFDLISGRIKDGLPTYGSCAGMILLANELIDGAKGQETFGGFLSYLIFVGWETVLVSLATLAFQTVFMRIGHLNHNLSAVIGFVTLHPKLSMADLSHLLKMAIASALIPLLVNWTYLLMKQLLQNAARALLRCLTNTSAVCWPSTLGS